MNLCKYRTEIYLMYQCKSKYHLVYCIYLYIYIYKNAYVTLCEIDLCVCLFCMYDCDFSNDTLINVF